MSWNDTGYFRERAITERAMAKAASDGRVIAVHREMAERYEALVKEGKRPTLHIVTAALMAQAA
jgi:hypothetical protein